MRTTLCACLAVLIASASSLRTQQPWRMLADPAAAGFDVEQLAAARALAERAGTAAAMAVDGGRVVVAWGDVTRRYKCHSVRKSVLSALFGIAIERGAIDPDETLAELGIDDLSPLSDVEKSACVRDLLAARSGIYHPAAKEPRDMKRNRPARHAGKPGERFHYNNWDFNVLGTVFNERVGQDLFGAFGEWLAGPAGMEDWRREDGCYELEPGNSRHPAYAFRLSTRDLARFGLLFAHGGGGVVPKAWVTDSTRAISKFEGGSGYGYMWWVQPAGSLAGHPALNAYDLFLARGTGGQVVMVVPDADFVFVHRADTDHDQRVRGGDVWRIAEALFAARPARRDPDAELRALRAEPFEGALPAPEWPAVVALAAARLQDYVGTFVAPGLGKASFFVHDGRLFARLEGGFEAEMFCSGDDAFFMRTNSVRIAFVRDDAGRVDGADIVRRGRKVRGRRVE